MDDMLWAWVQPRGTFLLAHIGWWIVAGWVLLWLFLWRFSRPMLKRLHHIIRYFKWINVPFPRLIRLLRRRFDNQHLSGLPLTLAATVFFAITLLLSGVVEDVVDQDFIVQFDHWIAASMVQAHTEWVVSVFYAITMLGTPTVLVPLWIITFIAFTVFGNRYWALPLFISSIGSISMSTLGKYGFARPRPTEALFVIYSPSFPSSHSTLAMSFYAVCFYLWWRHTTGWNGKFWIVFAGMSFVLLLSSSRIIIGVHYVSDVLAGFLLGSLWFIIAISLYEWLNFKKYIHFRSEQ
ncbi:MAG: phosphatase PAP2 family protein [Sulfuricurvum sp.]|uniref:phosphatase PAP2 family protein n=1 Tax=Sulfuricurvum sp. TaxID=2025608 RepID=UPI0026137164|nr:phosphatase PAP2 family protein [Sulfuricurvum sp.]MDD5119581.1 phosphatase PAP2 family protein [Sulfuricurvum sp.]